MMGQSVACKQLTALVTRYLDGCLSAADQQAVEQHLMVCDDCTEYLRQMRELVSRSASLLEAGGGESALPPGMLSGLLEAFRQRQHPVG